MRNCSVRVSVTPCKSLCMFGGSPDCQELDIFKALEPAHGIHIGTGIQDLAMPHSLLSYNWRVVLW